MPKSKRLMELMMAVNRKRKFTVKELAQEFNVSQRTILRDLQELSELGVPLYSAVGPHGGYQVVKTRILPPIAFSEEEAIAIFFAVHALRHFSSLPFATASSSALSKFYYHMPLDTRDRIDQMKHRVDFVTPTRQATSPLLTTLLDAAIQQYVLLITYQSHNTHSSREIQPIGIYTRNGLWYCLAHCFQHNDIRTFRCDRIHSTTPSTTSPLPLHHINLTNHSYNNPPTQTYLTVVAELTQAGVEACEAQPWPEPQLYTRSDGTGWLNGPISTNDLDFFAHFFLNLGHNITIQSPPELITCIKSKLAELTAKYG